MARDDVKIPIDKHRLTKRWTWPRIKRGNRGSSSPIEDRNHKRPLVNYFFSFHPAIIKETVENGKKPGFGVNRRCIHLTYHCRFLTERPTFHPRLFFSLPIGQSVSIFNAVLPSEPCTRTPARSVKAQWNGRESCMRGRPLRTRHPSVRLISIRVGTLGGASQFLPVFARVTIDRRFNAPWPCFRASLSATRFPERLNDRKRENHRLCAVVKQRRTVRDSFSFFFFSFCEVQLCFAPIQFQLLKSVTRILASSFFFFHEDERFNDLRWNFISLLRRTVNQILRGHRSLLGGFAICQNVPLSIHKDDQPQLSRPRVVNHDTRGKSRKRDEGWLFIFDR